MTDSTVTEEFRCQALVLKERPNGSSFPVQCPLSEFDHQYGAYNHPFEPASDAVKPADRA